MAQEAPSSSTAPQGGLTVTPFVSASTTYNDNLFLTATNPQSDTILSVSPGILFNYHSRRTDFNFLYSFSAVKYNKHYYLNSWHDEQHALIDWHHQATRRLQLGISGNYLETHNPGQLFPDSGLIIGRSRATRISVKPKLAYDFSPDTAMRLFYERAWRSIDSGNDLQTGTASAALSHQFSEHNAMDFGLQYITYNFDQGDSPSSTLITVGWTHNFSPSTYYILRAGPRNTNGNLTAEIFTSINYSSLTTQFSLAYRKTQTAPLGQSELLDTQGLFLRLAFTPTRNFTFGFAPAYYQNSSSTLDAEVWRLGAYAWLRFAPAWSLGLAYSYENQHSTFAGGSPSTIERNLVSLTLRWELPGSGPPTQILPPPTVGPGPNPGG